MATSRRRERELARRRFERRRQAEIERRAKTKKRNTVLGAVIGTIVIVAALVGGGFAIFGGSGKKKPAAAPKSSISAATTPTAAASSPAASASATPPPAAPTKCATITPNPPAAGEPAIPQPKGKLSTKLVTKDIKVGAGAPAKNGDAVTVQYVGVSCDSGKAFDASYTDGATNKEFSFTIGSTTPGKSVIAGWNQGVVGMKAGGVRELVIPSALAYGTAGGGATIPGNDTLVFVIHMVKV